MGQQQSKDELLYQKAVEGDIQAIKSLSSDGAGLEWIDKEGKTPLIAACMNPERYILAKTLIELGANINAYRPGRHAGTPLHHAAKRGLDQTVRLLLSHGVNLFVRNDDCQTPLDVARFRGFTNVARLVESHVCFFSGWLTEFYGPGFLEVLAPKLLSRKIWVVVTPCAPHNPAKPLKLELAIYSNFQDAQPRTVVALWRAGIEEPKLNLRDTTLIVFDKPTGNRYKFAASDDGVKQQIQSFYLACRGIPQVTHSPLPPDIQASAPTYSTQTADEAAELATAINASIDDKLNGWGNSTNKTTHNGWGIATESSPLEGSSSSNSLINEPTEEQQNGWGVPDPKHDKNKIQHNIAGKLNEPCKEDYNGWGEPVSKPAENNTKNIYMPQVQHVPSAPPIPMEGLDEVPIEYPSIDSSPVDVLPIPFLANKKVGKSNEIEDEDGSSCCVICWEAPVEGACVPCGHMAGCMACLDEIKTIKGDCPVCRTKINQVIRIYAV